MSETESLIRFHPDSSNRENLCGLCTNEKPCHSEKCPNDLRDQGLVTMSQAQWDKHRAENKRLIGALECISKNSCCETCQEARLVALKALRGSGEK